MKYYDYVDVNGNVMDTSQIISGFTLVENKKQDYSTISLATQDGLVFEEYVLWDSLQELQEAGVDISEYKV